MPEIAWVILIGGGGGFFLLASFLYIRRVIRVQRKEKIKKEAAEKKKAEEAKKAAEAKPEKKTEEVKKPAEIKKATDDDDEEKPKEETEEKPTIQTTTEEDFLGVDDDEEETPKDLSDFLKSIGGEYVREVKSEIEKRREMEAEGGSWFNKEDLKIEMMDLYEGLEAAEAWDPDDDDYDYDELLGMDDTGKGSFADMFERIKREREEEKSRVSFTEEYMRLPNRMKAVELLGILERRKRKF
ncbi:MAG: hypothetical protein FWD89_03330 [Firmicutes bacterium]|nr:hypothetical protein [Bacillota bacterium]